MLQQSTAAKMWGWAKPNSKVEVSVSWDKAKYQVTADGKNGRWEVALNTPKASYDTHAITVKGDGETVTIDLQYY